MGGVYVTQGHSNCRSRPAPWWSLLHGILEMTCFGNSRRDPSRPDFPFLWLSTVSTSLPYRSVQLYVTCRVLTRTSILGVCSDQWNSGAQEHRLWSKQACRWIPPQNLHLLLTSHVYCHTPGTQQLTKGISHYSHGIFTLRRRGEADNQQDEEAQLTVIACQTMICCGGSKGRGWGGRSMLLNRMDE